MSVTDSAQTTPDTTPISSSSARPNFPAAHVGDGSQWDIGSGDTNIRAAQWRCETHTTTGCAEQSSPSAIVATDPKGATRRGISSSDDQVLSDTHQNPVVASTPPGLANLAAGAIHPAPALADPLLALAADVLDDLETVWIANGNRLRTLTRTELDVNGDQIGFGLPDEHADVARLAALVDVLREATESATKNLERVMRKHPLGPWGKQIRGVGEKQLARLLAAIGDPYWNDLHDRPRLVSELWSYCGYGDPVKQVRRRGEKANWSPTAKKRAWLMSKSIVRQLVKPCHRPDGQAWAGHVDGCVCSPYRVLFDEQRFKYSAALHGRECPRCGPKGHPAQPGSPLSAGHQEACALRAVSKEILRDVWREAKRLHELHDGQLSAETHGSSAVVGPTSSGQRQNGTQPGLAAGTSSAGSDVPPS